MLTYDQARVEIFEYTELGYTLKSLDRCWVAATIEDGSSPFSQDYPEFIGNPIYSLVERGSSYDLMDDAAVFLSRRECEAFIATFGDPFIQWWFPLNLGDETRWEHAYLNGELHDLSGRRYTPKFKGSIPWFEHRIKVYLEKTPDRCCKCPECRP